VRLLIPHKKGTKEKNQDERQKNNGKPGNTKNKSNSGKEKENSRLGGGDRFYLCVLVGSSDEDKRREIPKKHENNEHKRLKTSKIGSELKKKVFVVCLRKV